MLVILKSCGLSQASVAYTLDIFSQPLTDSICPSVQIVVRGRKKERINHSMSHLGICQRNERVKGFPSHSSRSVCSLWLIGTTLTHAETTPLQMTTVIAYKNSGYTLPGMHSLLR